MNKGRCIGLVGGLGVGAAVHYYSRLAAAHKQRDTQLDLVMAHADVPQAVGFVKAGDRTGLAVYLAGFLRRMAATGAEFAVIPAVTPHYCIDELRPVSPLPILSIFDPIIEHFSRHSIHRAAVFGTRYVMQSDLYGRLPGVEFVHARPEELDEIDRTYMAIAESQRGTPEAFARLSELAQTFVSRDGAETILLAGTDLALVFNESNTQFPAIDCAALHLDAIVGVALDCSDS
jgi:aspartate racemase